ncbi:NtaA/DmoA family FMN-dependent monooxygenase [Solibacillus sp. FSL K6-1523]|uniref:NtaA/DmoA family FMN-dependent monooxygenase n=1 Tax=Solibacillus sp. FSL K6-1523 TaxID=2921471 RepID=UPI0030F564C5
MNTRKQLLIGLTLGRRQPRVSVKDRQITLEEEYASSIKEQIEIAQQAERAKLDFLFKADYVVAHPTFMKKSKGIATDPTLLFSIISQYTEKIGLVTTASTSFVPPYLLARQLQSLQWLSGGRAGWNVVTSIEGFENFSYEERPTSKIRYEKAVECTRVVKQLWTSYPHKVITGEYSESSIEVLNHKGSHFAVKGPLNVISHPKGTPPLFQAGASDEGRAFAAANADAIFAATPELSVAIELRADLRSRAVVIGRHVDEIRLLPGCYFFVGNTKEEAEEMHRQAHAHITMEQKYNAAEELLRVSLREFALTDVITEETLPPLDSTIRSRTHSELLYLYIEKNHPTVEEILSRTEVMHSAHWVVVGTAEEVAKEIIRWYEADAIDGIIAVPGGSDISLTLFLEQVIPKLAEQGLFRNEYTGSTLREHLGMDTQYKGEDK